MIVYKLRKDSNVDIWIEKPLEIRRVKRSRWLIDDNYIDIIRYREIDS